MKRLTATIGGLLIAVTLLHAQQTPTFRSNVNLLAIDVIVVDKTGEPILGLTPGDFEVKINNQVRRIVSADLVRYSSEAVRSDPGELALPPPPTSFVRTPGRLVNDSRVFVIAIDDASFLTGSLRPALQSAQRFVDNLRTNDVVALYVFPFEAPRLAFTHDHRSVRDAMGKMVGRRETFNSRFEITPTELSEIVAQNQETIRRVVARECTSTTGAIEPGCPGQLRGDAISKIGYLEAEGAQRLNGLTTLFESLAAMPGRKNVVIVSAGMTSSPTLRPDLRSHTRVLGPLAARGNINTYVIHVDESFNEKLTARNKSRRPGETWGNALADEAMVAQGLEQVAGESGGLYIGVKGGTGDFAYNRVLRETMAYYLLGVEPAPEDKNQRLMVGVKTTAKDATVRALREVIAK
jgi:VWFA-related protein